MMPARIKSSLSCFAALVFTIAVGAAPLEGKDWKKKPPAEWTAEEALEVLQNSPWAKKNMVVVNRIALRPDSRSADAGRNTRFPERRRRNPRNTRNRKGFPNSTFLVRLESARPVAAAFTRLQELELGVSARYQSPPPRLPEDRYVITVKAVVPRRSGKTALQKIPEERLMTVAILKTRHIQVNPAEVERSGEGATAAVHFFFPRTREGAPLINPQNPQMEFRIKSRRISLKAKFTLER